MSSHTDEPTSQVVSLLETAGFKLLGQPLEVAGIPFEFDAALVGGSSLDLVIVIDTVADTDEDRVRRRVLGLSQALDVVGSRRPLTVVLVGPPPSLVTTHALAQVARALVVGTPAGPNAEQELGDALAVLLPLELPGSQGQPSESWADVRASVLDEHPDSGTESILEASRLSAEAVSDALRTFLTDSLKERRG